VLFSIRRLYSFPTKSIQSALETELLRAAYAAFNGRDIDAALALMTPDVEWPRAFKGDFIRGREEIRGYWTEQWSEIDPRVEPVAFHPEDGGRILVDVHQVVRDLAGTILADEHVGHWFTFKDGLIQRMEVTVAETRVQTPSNSAGTHFSAGQRLQL
jgi:nuclear transport factor 2 (NTF2) superfamily protein